MKRWSTLLVALGALLLLSAGASHAVFPVPDGTGTFQLRQGWYGPGIPVWYIGTDASTIRFATTECLRLSPKLSRGFYGSGVAAMFIVTNGLATQGPVFETIPGQSLYSGIWRVRLVTWTDLSARVPLISIGQILALKTAGKLDYAESDTRADYPILAVGVLGNPFDPPLPILTYVTPQVKAINTKAKTVTLPVWNVYCADAITKRVMVTRVIIPDAGTKALAWDLGANLAPQLQLWALSPYQLAGTQRFWVFTGPQPLNQFPVIENCPPMFMISNSPYSPVGRYTVLQRNIMPWSVVDNPTTLDMYLDNGGLTLLDDRQFINAPVISRGANEVPMSGLP